MIRRIVLLALLCLLVLVPAGAALVAPGRTLDGAATTSPIPTGASQHPVPPRGGRNYADGIRRRSPGRRRGTSATAIFNDVGQNLFSENGVTQWGFVVGPVPRPHVRAPAGGRRRERADRVRPRPTRSRSSRTTSARSPFTRTPAAPGTGRHARRGSRSTRQQLHRRARRLRRHDDARLEWLREGPVDGNLANNGASCCCGDGYLPRARRPRQRRDGAGDGLMGRLMAHARRRRWSPATCGRTRTSR